MTWVLLIIIKGYKRFLSPLLGTHCRFYPTCSDYARQALIEYGFFRGVFMAIKRIGRCHPFHPGGYDPVKKSCEVKR